jgi:CRP-like cAMP-binding protein
MNTQSTVILTQGSQPPKKSPTEELSKIWKFFIKLGTKVVLEKKSHLFIAGDQNKHVYIVISGYLMLTKKNVLLDIVEPGQSLGAALLNSENSNQTYPISAISIDQAEVLQIPAESAFALMNSDPSVNEYFLRQVKQRINYLQLMRSIEHLPVPNRIAFFLLHKKFLLENTKITRKMISQAVSTTTETVIRSLARFEQKGIIEYIGRKIIIVNTDELEKLCTYKNAISLRK